jgi:NAD(P)H-quinone oxidoreductase subunit H
MAEGKKSAWNDFDYQYIAKKVAPTFKIPKGEHYVRLESGKGELGIFIVGHDDVFALLENSSPILIIFKFCLISSKG